MNYQDYPEWFVPGWFERTDKEELKSWKNFVTAGLRNKTELAQPDPCNGRICTECEIGLCAGEVD